MITTKLQGGLANQMFQIAAVYGYAKKHGFDYGFNFDNCFTPLQGHTSAKYKDSFFKNINRLDNKAFHKFYIEPTFSYTEIPKNDELVLSGFFQSEKYFKDCKQEIIELFSNFDFKDKDKILSFLYDVFKETSKDSVTVHVRRGDYITPPDKQKFHTNLADTTDYYQKAMEEFNDNNNFIFVSDDIQWCKDNFKGDNIFYSPFKTELDDLCLMTLSQGSIMANSSFSWWGAYLSQNEKVVAPKQWFGPTGPKDTQDIIPKNWIKI